MPSTQRTTVEQRTNTMHRVSIGLIAISLSLMSLALGTALFLSPSANFLFLPASNGIVSSYSSADSVTLTWTAPGDDNNTGQATSYDLRYSTSAITEGNFGSATPVAGLPAPSIAGSTESFTVGGLQPATTYFFALKTADEVGNVSALSNVASKTTDALPVACTPTYTCSPWSACVNGQQTKTCSVTNGCTSGLDAPITTQACTVAATPSTPTTPEIKGEPVHVVNPIIVAGLAPGYKPVVRVIDPVTNRVTKEFQPYSSRDRNGVNVAAGDVNGDGQSDVVVATGAGSNSIVNVYTARGQIQYGFRPYPTDKNTGVSVATGDVDGDGVDEIITVPAKGLSQVRIWKISSETGRFAMYAQRLAYDTRSTQGFTVTAGDMDLDGRAEIVVSARANARSVMILKLATDNKTIQTVKRFTPYPVGFRTGITVSMGDVFGTGRATLITAPGPGYYTDLRFFDINGKLQTNVLLISRSYRNAVDVTTQDVNSDGRDEIIVGSYSNQSGQIRIYRYDGVRHQFSLLKSYYPFSRSIRTGLRLGAS